MNGPEEMGGDRGAAVRPVAVIGTSLTARGWAVAFARGGHQVVVHNPDREGWPDIEERIGLTLADLSANDLLGGQSADEVAARIRQTDDLEDAVALAVHVQDHTSTRTGKLAMFEMLGQLAPDDAVLASSDVAILPSSFAEQLSCRSRILLAHPINPALLPVVEVAPCRWTAPDATERTCMVLRNIGLLPLELAEFDGMIIDRLAGALLHEAFRLVASGKASVADVDACVMHGLARRWVVAGPFETMDINFPGGIRDYIAIAEPLMRRIYDAEQRTAVDWGGALAKTVEAERRRLLPAGQIGQRLLWRDRQLARLEAEQKRWNDVHRII